MGQESLFGGDGDTAAALIPPNPTLRKVAEAARIARRCDLWRSGTQTVFGEGRAKAELMLVGEQPDAKEDYRRPPVRRPPAGKLLDKALPSRHRYPSSPMSRTSSSTSSGSRAGSGASAKPNAAEIAACRPWLDAELALIQPEVLVCLGATAAQALLGRRFQIRRDRGVPVESDLAPVVMATVHPSSILRSENREEDCPPRGGSATGRGALDPPDGERPAPRGGAGRTTRNSRAVSTLGGVHSVQPRFHELLEPEVAPLDGEAVDEGQTEEEADGEPRPVPRQDQRHDHQQCGVHAFVIAEVHCGRKPPVTPAAPDLASPSSTSPGK